MQSSGSSRSRRPPVPARHLTWVHWICFGLAGFIVFGEVVLRLASSSGLTNRGVRFNRGSAPALSDTATAARAAADGSRPSAAEAAAVAAPRVVVETTVLPAPSCAAVPAAGAAVAAAAAGAGAAPAAAPRNPWLSSQDCFENPDETELCILGPVCLTNSDNIVALVDRKQEYYLKDPRAWCPDHRTYRRTQHGCSKQYVRESWDPAGDLMKGMTPEDFAFDGRPPTLPLKGRKWLAIETMGDAKEIPYQAVVAAMSPSDIAAMGPEWVAWAAKADTSWLPPHGQEAGPGSIKRPKKVRWLDGAVYFANMRGEWHDHIWHWSTAAFPLFDAKRQNRSRTYIPRDDSPTGGMHYNTGKLDLPPMDYVMMTGRFPKPIAEVTDFPRWMQRVWPILTQRHTKLLANGNIKEPGGDHYMDDETITCTRVAVSSSFKPWLFTGLNEAQLFKMHAWQLAGVQGLAYDRYPPRHITIMTRNSRGFFNLDEVVAAVKATGLSYEINRDMGSLTWDEQVALMARTGILVAVHGAALTNVIFMPANAVVIEVFPYMYRSFLYRDLSLKAGLQYTAINSIFPDRKSPANVERSKHVGSGAYDVYESDEWMEHCGGPKLSSLDSYSTAECTHRAKYSFPYVDPSTLKVALDDALDDIGCRGSFCHEVEYKHHHVSQTIVRNMVTGDEEVFPA